MIDNITVLYALGMTGATFAFYAIGSLFEQTRSYPDLLMAKEEHIYLLQREVRTLKDKVRDFEGGEPEWPDISDQLVAHLLANCKDHCVAVALNDDGHASESGGDRGECGAGISVAADGGDAAPPGPDGRGLEPVAPESSESSQ